MAIRKRWGRWLGVAGLAILLIVGTVNLVSRWHDSGVGYITFIAVSVVGLAFLIYKLAAGDAVEEFFNGRSTEVPKKDPSDSDDLR